jgi:protein-L-isoaspartate(D-aspartate) O-methyltransferase
LQADGGEYNSQPNDAIFINAGASHARSAWLDNLRPGGRLLLPLTVAADPSATGMGFMLKVKRVGESHEARSLLTRFISLAFQQRANGRRH